MVEKNIKNIDHDDVPVLTKREVAMLLALAVGKMTGYEIARQCEEDLAGEGEISNGTLYPAIKRLERSKLIQSQEPAVEHRGRGAKVYSLTKTGRLILGWEIASYRRMIRLGEQRT